MERIMDYFKINLESADDYKKTQFCKSFSPPNAAFCTSKFGFVPKDKNSTSTNTVNMDICRAALANQAYSGSELQKRCLKEYAHFEIYIPKMVGFHGRDGKILGAYKNDEDGPYLSNFLRLINQKQNFLDLQYTAFIFVFSNVTYYMAIKEYSTNSSGMQLYNNSLPKRMDYPHPEEERYNITKVNVNNTDLFFEYIRYRPFGIDRDYVVLHFIRDKTYIQFDGSTINGMTMEEIYDLFLEIAKSIINQ